MEGAEGLVEELERREADILRRKDQLECPPNRTPAEGYEDDWNFRIPTNPEDGRACYPTRKLLPDRTRELNKQRTPDDDATAGRR